MIKQTINEATANNPIFCEEWTKPGDIDIVHSPSHYTAGGIEVIDYIRAKLTKEEFKGYCKGNIIKYISRAGRKESEKADIQKAKVYIEWLDEAI